MKRKRVKPLLVAIVGGSGSGKTWLGDRLEAELGVSVSRVCQDDFYRDLSGLPEETRRRVNFDHPRAIEWKLLERVLRGCVAGRTTRVPRYDFCTHCRKPRAKVVKLKSVVIVDGLWLLRRQAVRSVFDLRVFLECSTRTRLRRRLARDTVARGRTMASVHHQFWHTVEPMHLKYVLPQRRWADLVIRERCGATDIRRLAARIRQALQKNGK